MNHQPLCCNRREFLRLIALVAGGAAAAGCAAATPQPVESEGDYYGAQTDRLLGDYDANLIFFTRAMMGRYDEAEIGAIGRAARRAYAELIPQLPYIGGDANGLTTNLVQSAWCLALYRTLQSRGVPLMDVGRVLYKAISNMMAAYPPGFMHFGGLLEVSTLSLESLKAGAAQSQQRRYANDWVYTAVRGNGDDFDFGVDYTECGIVKFYQAQGAPELTPYLCQLDFPMSAASGSGLARTMTLGNGDAVCDFRYKWGRPVQPSLAEGFLEGMW